MCKFRPKYPQNSLWRTLKIGQPNVENFRKIMKILMPTFPSFPDYYTKQKLLL